MRETRPVWAGRGATLSDHANIANTNVANVTSITPPPPPPPPPIAAALSFLWDQSDSHVKVYLRGDKWEGVGPWYKENKDKVTCTFTPSGIAFRVQAFKDGKSYALVSDNLEKEIDPATSKMIVKKNKIIIKLAKQGESFDRHWMTFNAKKKKKSSGSKVKEDPMGGIMDLMKDMYEDGDEQMRATIGKAMEESRKKQLNPGYQAPGDDSSMEF